MKSKAAILFSCQYNVVLSITPSEISFSSPAVNGVVAHKDATVGEVVQQLQKIKGLYDVRCLLPAGRPAKHLQTVKGVAVPAQRKTYVMMQYPSPKTKPRAKQIRKRIGIIVQDAEDLEIF